MVGRMMRCLWNALYHWLQTPALKHRAATYMSHCMCAMHGQQRLRRMMHGRAKVGPWLQVHMLGLELCSITIVMLEGCYLNEQTQC